MNKQCTIYINYMITSIEFYTKIGLFDFQSNRFYSYRKLYYPNNYLSILPLLRNDIVYMKYRH